MINKERYSFIFLAILAMLDQLIASLFGSCYDMKGKSADFDGERLEATE